MHISKIINKSKSKYHDKTPYYFDEHGIAYRKFKDGSNIFHTVMVPQSLETIILYESYNALGHNGSTRLYNFIKRFNK